MEQLGSYLKKNFMKFDIWEIFENLYRKVKFDLKSYKNSGYYTGVQIGPWETPIPLQKFHEISYMRNFRKSAQKSQVLFKILQK